MGRNLYHELAKIGIFLLTVFLILPLFCLLLIAFVNTSRLKHDAAQGYQRDQYVLGVSYLTGNAAGRTFGLIGRDNREAMYWLGAAAKSGYVAAYEPYAEALEQEGQKANAAQWRTKAVIDGKKEAAREARREAAYQQQEAVRTQKGR